MEKLLQEIVKEFKSLSLEKQIEELQKMDGHDVAISLGEIESVLKSHFDSEWLRTLWSRSLSLLGQVPLTISDFEDLVDAANDERFALAA